MSKLEEIRERHDPKTKPEGNAKIWILMEQYQDDARFLISLIDKYKEAIDEALKHSKDAPYDLYENKDRLLEVRAILQHGTQKE